MTDRREGIRTNQKTITRLELNKMAKERGMKGYHNLRKLELAKRLGMELPKPMRNKERKPREDQRRPRKARRVEAIDPDGTMTAYPNARNFEDSYVVGSTHNWLRRTRHETRHNHHEFKTHVMERNDEEQIFRERPRREKGYSDPNHHRGHPGDHPALSPSTGKTLRPVRYWSGIHSFVNFFNGAEEFQKSPYRRRCERGSGRARFQTTSSTRNLRSFPGKGCWGTT